MRKYLIAILLSMVFCSCSTPTMLYSWDAYETNFYNYYKRQDPKDLVVLLGEYENMINNPGGSRGVVPPGICAEYGYLLLHPDTPTAFRENASALPRSWRKSMKDLEQSTDGAAFREKGLKMLQKEIELYPESTMFMEPIIKKFSQQ